MRPPSEVVHTVKCAVCNALKQKTNNWWKVTLEREGLLLQPMGELPLVGRLNPLTGNIDNMPLHYLCGNECVAKLVTEYMAEETEKHNEQVKKEGKHHAWNSSENVAEESKQHQVVRDSWERSDCSAGGNPSKNDVSKA